MIIVGLEDSFIEKVEEAGHSVTVISDSLNGVLKEDTKKVNETQFHDVIGIRIGMGVLDEGLDAIYDRSDADGVDELVVVLL